MRGGGRVFLSIVIVAAAVLASCGPPPAGPRGPGELGASTATAEVASNVLFADYAGTQACEPCHAARVKTWLASPMHNMTREPSLADVKGPFD